MPRENAASGMELRWFLAFDTCWVILFVWYFLEILSNLLQYFVWSRNPLHTNTVTEFVSIHTGIKLIEDYIVGLCNFLGYIFKRTGIRNGSPIFSKRNNIWATIIGHVVNKN